MSEHMGKLNNCHADETADRHKQTCRVESSSDHLLLSQKKQHYSLLSLSLSLFQLHSVRRLQIIKMAEIRSSPPPTTTTTTNTATTGNNRRRETSSPMNRMKKGCQSFGVSMQEGFNYVKATLVGQAKKATARNEKESTKADLMTAKMQVEAVDAAEDAKNRLDKSM